MFKILLLLLCLLINFSFSESDSAGIEMDSTPASTDRFQKPEKKSALVAFAWAVGGSFAPLLIGVPLVVPQQSELEDLGFLINAGAYLVGPSSGQFYAQSYRQAWYGIGLRTGGAVIAVFGAGLAFATVDCDMGEGQSGEGCGRDSDLDVFGGTLIAIGTLTSLGGLVYSYVDTHYAVKRYNRKQKIQFGWTPLIAPDLAGKLKTGAQAWATF